MPLIMPTTAIDLIAAERQRQITQEGWTPEHDDEHDAEQLACGAAYYALPPAMRVERVLFLSGAPGPREIYEKRSIAEFIWPWTDNWRKPTPNNRVKELVKAGAMIAAEIERLQCRERDEEE